MKAFTDYDFHPELQASFEAAVQALVERNVNNNYRDNWRKSALGTRGAFGHLFSKAERLKQQIWETPQAEWKLDAAIDSALDAINFAAMTHALLVAEKAARQARADDIEGVYIEPEKSKHPSGWNRPADD